VRHTPRPGRGLPKDATRDDVEGYLTSLVATRVFGEDPEPLARAVELEREATAAEALQRASRHRDPGVFDGAGARRPRLNRQLRRARSRKKRIAKVVAGVIAKARALGDPNWKPEAFPALDWSIQREVWALMRDPTGRKARIFAAGLPAAQAEQLILEARLIVRSKPQEDPYASMRWRELVAAAWASWRLSRPVRSPRTGVGTRAKHRENPWAGGRVVDGYARQAFCLLMRDIRTGKPLSMSKLFQRNGSGELGAVKYLAGKLYTRHQPPAHRSRYVGPAKRGPDGQVLLDKHGRPQRWALAQHWYHRDMCGRRAAAAADRGRGEAGNVVRTLCPWLFADEHSPERLLEELAGRGAVAACDAFNGPVKVVPSEILTAVSTSRAPP